MGEADEGQVMGSVTQYINGKQGHWTDKWHAFAAIRNRIIRQKKSLAGQKSLCDDEPADHSKSKISDEPDTT